MGWFRKKEVNEQEESSVPKVPDLPELPEIGEPAEKRLPELPKQPKDSLDTQLPKLKETLPELPEPESEKDFELPTLPREMQKSRFSPLPSSRHEKIPSIPITNLPDKKPKEKAIYIRLDKFEHTEESFEEIKNKIIEIESLLKKIKDIKSMEERELEDWEREIQVIKARIESIEKNIFNSI